jgi:hypothetical protein
MPASRDSYKSRQVFGVPQSMIELTGEANSIYFIRIQNGAQSSVRKVVLAH